MSVRVERAVAIACGAIAVMCITHPTITASKRDGKPAAPGKPSSAPLVWPLPPETPRIRYVRSFQGVNDFKPAMIAEATKNARQAAQEFARESKAKVGGMRRASQGVFEILPRDPAPGIAQEGQIAKTLRVVSTVEFLLD